MGWLEAIIEGTGSTTNALGPAREKMILGSEVYFQLFTTYDLT